MVGEEGVRGRNSKVARYAACQEFRNGGREGGGIKDKVEEGYQRQHHGKD
jgi:hypothetical protein